MAKRAAGGRLADAPPAAPPAPDVVCRLAEWHEVPKSAQGIATAALAAGWHVVCTYARGPLVGSDGYALRTVDSVAVRMRSQLHGAVGVWHSTVAGGYSFDGGYVWLLGATRFPQRVSFADLKCTARSLADGDGPPWDANRDLPSQVDARKAQA